MEKGLLVQTNSTGFFIFLEFNSDLKTLARVRHYWFLRRQKVLSIIKLWWRWIQKWIQSQRLQVPSGLWKGSWTKEILKWVSNMSWFSIKIVAKIGWEKNEKESWDHVDICFPWSPQRWSFWGLSRAESDTSVWWYQSIHPLSWAASMGSGLMPSVLESQLPVFL